MGEPRLFFLSLSPGAPGRELPSGWRNIEADENHAAEVAPGVRATLASIGDCMLPGWECGYGAVIALWEDAPAAVEWGIVRPEGASGSDDVWRLGDVGDAYARQLLRHHRSINGDDAGWLVTREIGQWKKVQDG